MLEPDLMDALRRFARCCRSCVAPRPGSNALPLLELRSDDEAVSVDCEDMEAMYRAGLLIAEPEEEEHIVEGSEEYGGIEANYLWRLSPAGRTALGQKDIDRG